MSNRSRAKRLVALTAGLSLVAMACGGDDDDGPTETTAGEDVTETTTAETEADGTEAPSDTTAAGASEDTGGAAPSGETAMTLTVDLNPDAVWEDGSPITVADIECTWQAFLNTPASLQTVGYDKITAVTAGDSDKQVIIEFSEVYGPYKTLFDRILKKAAIEDEGADCNDISSIFQEGIPFSGRPYILQEWSPDQSIFVPNENYWGEDAALTDTVVMVPQTDQDTEVASLLAGQVDFIYPQFGDYLSSAVQDPNIDSTVTNGNDYEALYFQQLEGPFADPVFREAFSKSIDRQALFDQIYAPIFAAADAEGELLNCGLIVQGPYCPPDNFQDTYDPAAAEQLLTDAGWEKDGAGFWAMDGAAPEIRWMINAGNVRRENAQAYLIPLLAQAGFNVVPSNGTPEEVFQQRLPTLDYDLAMYISTAAPDPTYLTPILTCDNIPTEENDFQGQNQSGWCNEEATAALYAADQETDEEARKELIYSAMRALDTDHVALPLVNYPKSSLWRTDKLGGPVDADTASYRSFQNFSQWEDTDGDGQIVIGAEQWPDCLNPITECANSSWLVYTASFPLMPALWDATPEQTFELTNLVEGEPVVEVM